MKITFFVSLVRFTAIFVMTLASCVYSASAQTVTYEIHSGNIVNMYSDWCHPDDRGTCGGVPAITWTSVNSGTVQSAYIEFYISYHEDLSPLLTSLNGNSNNNFEPTNTYCSHSTYLLNIQTTGYNAGGVNTFQFDNLFDCLIFDKNTTWSNAYARVVVTYDNGSTTPVWSGTGNWTDNPNWSSTPGAADSVVVQSGTLTVNTNATVNDLTIESGTTVIVEAGQTLIVTGNLLNNGGAFSVQPGGSLVLQNEMKRNGATKIRTFGALKVMSGSITLGN